MLAVMAVAGASSGLCLAWTYRRLTDRPYIGSWVRYNLTYMLLFAFIPALSVIMFDPVMTFAEAAESEGPLDELILEALPMTVGVTVAIAVIVSLLFGSLRQDFGPVLITSVVLMLFLGLNLTIIGLVEFSGGPSRRKRIHRAQRCDRSRIRRHLRRLGTTLSPTKPSQDLAAHKCCGFRGHRSRYVRGCDRCSSGSIRSEGLPAGL